VTHFPTRYRTQGPRRGSDQSAAPDSFYHIPDYLEVTPPDTSDPGNLIKIINF